MPSRHHAPRDLRDAGPRDRRGDRRAQEARARPEARDHDPARLRGRRARDAARREPRRSSPRSAAEKGVALDIPIGTMIELPRAAVTADEIGKVADFFSFGTNDLTQTTFGFSRDDIESKFLPKYLERKILPRNPFETIDPGVAELVEMGCEAAAARPSPASSSASAASTAAIPSRSRRSSRSASTTCRARRTACRSHGSRRRRRRLRPRRPARTTGSEPSGPVARCGRARRFRRGSA